MPNISPGILSKLPSPNALIGGEIIQEFGSERFEHVYPGSGAVIGDFPLADAELVDRAVSEARRALPNWKSTAANERRGMMLRLAALFREHAQELAEITVMDNGAPLMIAQHAPLAAADSFEYFAGWSDKMEGSVIPVWPGEAFDYKRLEPYGVIAAIIPFNGPVVSVGLRLGPILAAGNTVVLKTSEYAPYAAMHIAALTIEAGFPPGVINIIPGTGAAGQTLVQHQGVDKVVFTGGVATAKNVLADAAKGIKPVALELGGKSANIVFADADLDAAAGMAVYSSVVAMSGQTCICPSRLLVEGAVYDEFVATVLKTAAGVSIGDPFDAATMMGPVINAMACNRIATIVENANQQQVGELLTGGERLGGDLADGFYFPPTIFGNVDNTSELARQEIFGPVLSITRFDDEDEAIALANDSEYGLAGYIHTRSIKREHRLTAELDAGYVSVNGAAPMPPGAPFGGNKMSGIGRLGGKDGVLEFMRAKNVYVAL